MNLVVGLRGQMIVRAILILFAFVSVAWAAPISRNDIHVKDGDTIYYRDVEYRMIGYGSPETKRVPWRTVSKDEMALGEISKARLEELLKSGPVDLTEVQCSCPAKKIENGTCNHHRLCGILSVNGENVGKSLIAEELAVPFVCGKHRCPKMPDWQKIIDTQFPR
jgi:endonuclease YncB( thermonuclease family)